jgi:hypothetical protein
MFIRTKTVRSLSLATAGALLWTGLGAATSAQAVTWTCASVKTVSWGSGQVCKGSDGSWKLRNRDEATDGYCVEGYYYSQDRAAYRQTSPRSQECNGVWKTTIMNPIPYQDGVRLYRNTNYTNLPLP